MPLTFTLDFIGGIGKTIAKYGRGIMFYPAIFGAAIWTILNILKIYDFTMSLKETYPDCTTSNPNRIKIFCGTIFGLICTQIPIERFFKGLFMRVLRTDKFPLGSDLRESKSKMLGERVFRFINYSFCTTFLLVTLRSEGCDFLDWRIGGSNDRPLYYKSYPC